MIRIFFLLAIILMASCGREDIAKKIEPSLSAEVDGDSIGTTDASFTFTDGNILEVRGKTADSLEIVLELDSADQVGMYDLSNTADYEALFIDSLENVYTTRFTGVGLVEITVLTQTTVEGTFEFSARNLSLGTRQITKGVFVAPRGE